MQVRDLTLEVVKDYLRIDTEDDDVLINLFIQSAISHARDITGISQEQLLEMEDLTAAILLLVGEFYDNRTVQINDRLNTRINTLVENMLYKHSINLI